MNVSEKLEEECMLIGSVRKAANNLLAFYSSMLDGLANKEKSKDELVFFNSMLIRAGMLRVMFLETSELISKGHEEEHEAMKIPRVFC